MFEELALWPLTAITNTKLYLDASGGLSPWVLLPGLVGFGAAYYVGGLPFQGQTMQQYAVGYAAGTVGFLAGATAARKIENKTNGDLTSTGQARVHADALKANQAKREAAAKAAIGALTGSTFMHSSAPQQPTQHAAGSGRQY